MIRPIEKDIFFIGQKSEAATKADQQVEIHLQDTQWPYEYTDHDRLIVRAIVIDDAGRFYFMRASRDDDFGKAEYIETSGGGVEEGEDLETALSRELKEELGVDVEILCKIGTVSDYYNRIHRHNMNHYFLCRILSFGEKHLTRDEIEEFHLTTVKLSYEAAVHEYEKCSGTKLGKLIANRELPVLKQAIDDVSERLNEGGRLCIITFHSLEDRIVKEAFRKQENPCICPPQFPVCVCGKKPLGKVVTRKPIAPSKEELEVNPRSRSAKLRVLEGVE